MAKVKVFVLLFTFTLLQYAVCTNTINGGDFEWNENNMIDVTSFVDKVLEIKTQDFVTPNSVLKFVNCRNIYYSTDSTMTEFFLEKWEELENIVDTHFMKNCSKSKAPRINIAFRVNDKISDDLENYWKDRKKPVFNINSSGIFSVILDWSGVPRAGSEPYRNLILIKTPMLKEYFNLTSVKIATEFKAEQFGVDGIQSTLYYSDLIIFKLPFLREQFPLSISLLQTYVQKTTSSVEKYKQKGYKIYYHFQLQNIQTSLVKNNVLKKYQNIFLNYTLIMSSYTQTPIILDSLLFAIEINNESVNQRLKSLSGTQSIKPNPFTSYEMERLQGVGTVFKSIYLEISEWVCWVDCQKNPSNISTFSENRNCQCGSATLQASINATLIVDSNAFNDTLSYIQIPQSGNITVDKIVLSTGDNKAWLNSPDLNNIISPIRNLAMKKEVVCSVEIDLEEVREEITYTHPVLSPCRDLLDMNITNQIMWRVAIVQLQFEWNIFKMNIFSDLERINIQRLRFQMENPKIHVKLMISFTYNKEMKTSSLYCDENILRYNQVLEAMINWAGVHDITIGFAEYSDVLGNWWISVRGPEELIQNEYTFVTSIRNAPMSMSNMIKIDPCLKKSSSVSETIPFAQDMIGVTLLCNVSTAFEFEVMLRFALFKFSQVEIRIGKEVENIGKVTTALREIFHSGFDTDTGTQGRRRILIEMDSPEENSRQQKYLQELAMLVTILEDSPSISVQGVHINFGEDIGFSVDILEKVEKNLQVHIKKGLRLGVSIQNCARELNKLTGNPSAAEKFYVKYVICQESRVVASNQNEYKHEQLLDGYLVLKTAFHNVNPNLEKVYFQLELVGSTDIRPILTFLNDINQYGKGYKVSFLFPAFDISYSGTLGWWRVDSSLSLKQPHAYSEKEGEILFSKTRRPNIPDIPTDSTAPTNIKTVVLSVLGTAGVAVVVMSLVAYRMKRRHKVLSRSEEKDFIKGKESIGNDSAYENLTFDKSYSLSKDEIQHDSSKILGAGNFGTVFKGVCRGNLVAVKAPNDGCSKEIFKSMLIEVKLLCYIGEHDNVITFVGAYVKEISKGVIHIATALCENGSLQSYLRRSQTETRNGTDNNEIEMTSMDTSELIKFSQQIASGMNYISGKNVVHGDLATRNVLLDEYNVCKIADFGLARKLYEYNKYVKQSHEPLPWRWLSYESLKMMEFTTKSDVWSYGVTLWEIFSLGAVPYPGLGWTVEFVDELERGMRMTQPKLGTNEMYEKMRDCWNISPDLRPTFANLNEYFASQIQSDYMVCEEQL